MKDSVLHKILTRSVDLNRSIVFPEAGIDSRVLQAVADLEKAGSVKPILLNNSGDVQHLAYEEGISIPDSVTFVDIDNKQDQNARLDFFEEKFRHKNLAKEQLLKIAKNPLMIAGWLVAIGRADGAVAGSIASTADVIRASLRTIGTAEDIKLVSSSFLMEMTDGSVLTYADCGVVPYPNAEQLADIAIISGKTHKMITGEEPSIAFLSFSTKGSAMHDSVDLVRNALEIASAQQPSWAMDGELQFDAAYLPTVAERKAPGSPVAGHANVYIFPNLDAGNIAYKITERIGGATAIGPILQGLKKPYMDLSRGCSVEDIFYAACIASILSDPA